MSIRRKGHGVVDGDPFAIVLILYMFFVLLFWFQSSAAINPIAGNSTIRANFATSFNGIKWLGLMLAPFAIFIFLKAFTHEGSSFGKGEEEEE